ncbi:MAG: hypothetical protein CBB68_13095 [Rhodospirillaceae bacterium TMED8]|nr:hypothetical protein [Magnetovibrio sp.]OUT49039.1 MAG: hypothetical protein CBB68_13095 [Rhodospirillaceae bacterium TMED8]|tara:strand:- start:508 stop:1587 length:1080 start_codon:yes stop_codon:yes gene_type:complete
MGIHVMNPKSLQLLALFTAIAVGGAAWTLNVHRLGSGVEVSGAVFPSLIDEVNSVVTVLVEHRNKSLTMTRGTFGGWSMVESDGYAVSAKAAEKVVVQLSDLHHYELKTRKADLYDRLHVGDPKANNADARQIRLLDAKGEELANLIVGRKRYNLAGARREGVYIRKPGNIQTWLAAGELDVDIKPGNWLDNEIVDVREGAVERVTVRHPDGESLTVVRADPEGKEYVLLDIPPGKELKFDTDPKTLAGVTNQLNMDDVRKDGFIKFIEDQTLRANFITENGLSLMVYLVNQNDVAWARFEASIVSDASLSKDVLETAQARVREINARVRGWVYALPSFKASRINRRAGDMLKDKKPLS